MEVVEVLDRRTRRRGRRRAVAAGVVIVVLAGGALLAWRYVDWDNLPGRRPEQPASATPAATP